ncbi:MAG: hypothetical protein R6V58_02395 [Planctomycetota bacterium]
MRSIKRAEEMSPEERRREVAAILARGFLRLRSRRGYVPEAESDASTASEDREKSSQN